MRMKKTLRKTGILGAALVLSVACSKKKSSSTAAAPDGSAAPTEDALVTLATGSLQLASDVTILPGNDAANASLALNGSKEVSFKLLDDSNKTVRLRVTNEAFQDVEQAGSIMCMLGQTKFWEKANAGVYQAQIDQNLCGKNGGGGGDQSQGGGSDQSPQLQVVYVNSVREEGKPLIATMRVAAGEGKEDAWYHVKAIVVEPPSETAPAGIFDMHYTAHMGSEIGESGFIRTRRLPGGGEFVLENGSSGKDGGGSNHVSTGIAQLTFVDENTVTGFVHSDSSGSQEGRSFSSVGKARFDANFLNVDYTQTYTHDGKTESSPTLGCYDLHKYKTAMFRYNLFDAKGSLVKVNSGFPIEVTVDGQMIHGWAGYYGLWTNNQSLASGTTVNKVSWTGGQKVSTPYTIFSAPGKLTKLTKATTTLSALKGADMNYYDNGSNYNVKWDGKTLSKTAKITNGKNGPEEEAASGEITIPQWGAGVYVPSLNAQIRIPPNTTLSDALVLAYHAEATVSGSKTDAPTCNLVCFQNCPNMTPTAANFQRSTSGSMGPMVSDLYKKIDAPSGWGQSGAKTNQTQTIASPLATYQWDAATQNLKDVATSTLFTLPSGLPTDQNQAQQLNNIWSGALVCADVYAALDKTIDPFRMEQNIDSFYRFSSGAQAWNQYTSLKDSNGTIVTFDKPLQISYTHTTANDWDANTDAAFIGKSFRLEYNGPGQLNGIPWKQSKDIGHYMPQFSIKSGVKAGDYTIYPTEGEQRLAKADSASCAAIPLDSVPEMPELDNVIIDNGALGDATSPLLYVSGVATE